MIQIGEVHLNPWPLVTVLGVMGVLVLVNRISFRHRFAPLIVLILVACCGLVLAWDAHSAPHGYVAGYTFGAVWLLALFSLLAGLPLMVFRRLRKAGLIGLMAAGTLLSVFYLTYTALNLISPQAENAMVEFGPNVQAGLVVVFEDVNREAVSALLDATIYVKHPGGGHSFRSGIQGLWAVSISGRRGYSIRFSPSATADQIAEIKARFEAAPIVWYVGENVAPSDILVE